MPPNAIFGEMKRLYFFIHIFLLSALCFAQQNVGIRVIGRIPDATDDRLYQMQVGAFKLLHNASNAHKKLVSASLKPSYEEYHDLIRVLIRGVGASDVPSYIEKIRKAGFSEVFIKLEPVNGKTAAAASGGKPSSAERLSAANEIPEIYVSPISPESRTSPQDNNSEKGFPKTGSWKLTGRDPAGDEWKADIVITNVRNNNFNGYFDWYMEPDSDYRGREYFTGRFDDVTDKVFFQGTRLENGGSLALGKYEAYVTIRRDSFYNGKWEEADGIPNSYWQATLDEDS